MRRELLSSVLELAQVRVLPSLQVQGVQAALLEGAGACGAAWGLDGLAQGHFSDQWGGLNSWVGSGNRPTLPPLPTICGSCVVGHDTIFDGTPPRSRCVASIWWFVGVARGTARRLLATLAACLREAAQLQICGRCNGSRQSRLVRPLGGGRWAATAGRRPDDPSIARSVVGHALPALGINPRPGPFSHETAQGQLGSPPDRVRRTFRREQVRLEVRASDLQSWGHGPVAPKPIQRKRELWLLAVLSLLSLQHAGA